VWLCCCGRKDHPFFVKLKINRGIAQGTGMSEKGEIKTK
jgi:hypothetical protein